MSPKPTVREAKQVNVCHPPKRTSYLVMEWCKLQGHFRWRVLLDADTKDEALERITRSESRCELFRLTCGGPDGGAG